MHLIYRKLTADEASKYRAIRLECLKAYPNNFGSNFEEQSQLPKLMFEKVLEKQASDKFVMGAFDQEQLIGICGFLPYIPFSGQTPSDTAVLIQVYVQQKYSGNRIGLGLIQATVKAGFSATAVDKIMLEVKADNASAIRVYTQAGFRTYTPSTAERDEDTVYMLINREQSQTLLA